MSHCFSTVTRPLASQPRRTPRRHHRNSTECLRQRKSERLEFHRAEGHRGDSQKNEDQLLHEGEPVRILGNTSAEEFGEETLRNWHQEESRVTRCASWTTPAKTVKRRRNSRQSESTNRSPMCVCHCRFWKRPSQW